jgi:glycosyltransferase involved in cell wall biosynthesis
MADRPIRVMNIISRLNVGGPTIDATLLTEKFQLPDYESVLVCGMVEPGEGDMSYYAEQHGVTPIVIPELGRSLHPIKDIVTLRKVYALIRDYQPDVIHTHTAKAGFIGRTAARLAGVPVIVHTFHGHIFRGFFNPFLTQLFIQLERWTASMSDTIIALTDGLRRELAEDYHIARKKHITVLPLGLDLDGFAGTARHSGTFRAACNLPEDAPLVGIVGRIVEIKNHALFLDAAVRVRARQPNVHFVIVGDGELRPETEARVDALGLRGAVTFTGWLRDLTTIYSDLDVVVISSLNEGTPVSVIESLAAGCPVVATAVGGLPDLLDQGSLGRLVKAGDADALAASILQTLKDPPDVAAAQRLMVDRYGIDRLVKDLDELYRGLLAKKRRAR